MPESPQEVIGLRTTQADRPAAASRWRDFRQFIWTSSVSGEAGKLRTLASAMERYYSEQSTRESYQAMLESDAREQPETETALCTAILDRRPMNVLEVGCGSGHMLQRLRTRGVTADYTGIEVSAAVIARNRQQWPNEKWIQASIYEPHLPHHSFDVVFGYFVLEHCYIPERH